MRRIFDFWFLREPSGCTVAWYAFIALQFFFLIFLGNTKCARPRCLSCTHWRLHGCARENANLHVCEYTRYVLTVWALPDVNGRCRMNFGVSGRVYDR